MKKRQQARHKRELLQVKHQLLRVRERVKELEQEARMWKKLYEALRDKVEASGIV